MQTRGSLILAASFALGAIAVGSAAAESSLENIPAPVLIFAKQFENECRGNGLGSLVVNENYSDDRGQRDWNADGRRDYIVYKCMFGCDKNPFAFTGISSPCAWGSLLLSNGSTYDQIFLPGRVTRIAPGPPISVSIKRPRGLRLIGNFCEDPFPDYDPEYVYELKDHRFQVLGMCSADKGMECLPGSVSASGF